jgi:tetratricopeptide (TPR) repeat protein
LLILITYSNTFEASWHLDDYPTIVNNPRLKIPDLHPKSLAQTFYASRDGGLYLGKKLSRPIAHLTFALNWYAGKNDVFGYHVVNLAIHFLTAFLLYLTVLNLFKSPKLKDAHAGSEHFIALFSAALWAVSPVQTQAVTYIVQRVASLATLFYILGILCYIKARITESTCRQLQLLSGCLLSFLLAIGSKENAATFPVAVMLTEIAFFQDLSHPKTKKKFIYLAAATLVGMVLIGIMLSFNKDPIAFFKLKGYGSRSFTLTERLLTEPRVVVFYISQLFYPAISRLSIAHDVLLSTSLLKPWTTLPAILFILSVITLGLLNLRKRPVIAYAILFFFLNHIVESTILPLELVFEHRNYLPSLFLFCPGSIAIKWLFDYYRKKNRPLYSVIVSACTLLIIGLGLGTYIRNMSWSSEKTLWEDAMDKAPGRARPLQNLAWGYYGKIGELDHALALYEKAIHLAGPNRIYVQIMSLHNMAALYHRKRQYEKAIELCKKALDVYPDAQVAMYQLALSLMAVGNWKEASKNAQLLLTKNYLKKDNILLCGFSLLKQKKYEQALAYFKYGLRMYPNNKKLLYNTGVTLSLMGKYERAQWFLRTASRISPDNILTLLYLIENSLKAGDAASVENYLDILFNTHSIQKIEIIFKGIDRFSFMVTFSPELVAPVLAGKMEEKIQELETMSY